MDEFVMWHKDYEHHKQQYDEIFHNVMSHPNHETSTNLEEYFKPFVDRKFCLAVDSATAGLHFSLLAMGVGEGDEVLVSDFTWISSASCVSMCGATPVLCDVDLDSYHISLDSIKRMTSDKTKVLIYTPLFGNMTDTSEIEVFCAEKGIQIIEDAAQALGSSLNGRKAGSIGDCSVVSLAPNKVISGISTGGMFCTDDPMLADYVARIRRHGSLSADDFEMLGYNSRSFLLNNEIVKYRMSRMDEFQTRRQQIAAMYNEAFGDLPLQLQYQTTELNHNFHKYTIRFEDRATRDFARKSVPAARVHYVKPISENGIWTSQNYVKDHTPNTRLITETILTLPNDPYMSNEDINMIIERVEMCV